MSVGSQAICSHTLLPFETTSHCPPPLSLRPLSLLSRLSADQRIGEAHTARQSPRSPHWPHQGADALALGEGKVCATAFACVCVSVRVCLSFCMRACWLTPLPCVRTCLTLDSCSKQKQILDNMAETFRAVQREHHLPVGACESVCVLVCVCAGVCLCICVCVCVCVCVFCLVMLCVEAIREVQTIALTVAVCPCVRMCVSLFFRRFPQH